MPVLSQGLRERKRERGGGKERERGERERERERVKEGSKTSDDNLQKIMCNSPSQQHSVTFFTNEGDAWLCGFVL